VAYVVTEACIKCKYMDCIQVCPVECFYEGENMVVINPNECIDCSACELECPVQAIVPEKDPRSADWRDINRTHSREWPNIAYKGIVPADADEWRQITSKRQFFSPHPAPISNKI